jgi:replicative DNA helicase
MIDYLDLLMPVSAKVSPNDLFVKDKYVSEELRNLAKELGILMITASQLNRSAVDEIEFDHSHISGGISKINTADNVFGIFTSRAMRERGRYQIQCMKSRSSTGVGMKIDLDYNIETMRITDSGEDASQSGRSAPTSIMEQIKSKSTVINNDTGEISDPPAVRAEVGGNKLKSMLADIKSQSK